MPYTISFDGNVNILRFTCSQRDSKGDDWTMFWLALSIRDKKLCDEAWERMSPQARIRNVLDAVQDDKVFSALRYIHDLHPFTILIRIGIQHEQRVVRERSYKDDLFSHFVWKIWSPNNQEAEHVEL